MDNIFKQPVVTVELFHKGVGIILESNKPHEHKLKDLWILCASYESDPMAAALSFERILERLSSPETKAAPFALTIQEHDEIRELMESNQKIFAIKKVRAISGYGLKQAKTWVEEEFAHLL